MSILDQLTTTPEKPAREYRYPVSEIFGPVCQGEGMLIGKPTVFVRLGGCDYRCAWCDSLYAVLPEHRHTWEKLTASEVAHRVLDCLPDGFRHGHVTLSGGNPAVHLLGELIDLLHTVDLRVGIETQGTARGAWAVRLDDVTLSPKPPSSGNMTPYGEGTSLDTWISGVTPHQQSLCLKVVAFDDEDYAYAKALHLAYPWVPFFLQAGTVVNVATRDDLCDALSALQARVCADPDMQDVSVLPQLHAVLHGHQRGI